MFLNQAALLLGHVPLPGPVLGLVALLGALAVRGSVPAALERAATPLIGLMPLFLIPVCVGLVPFEGVLGRNWLALATTILVSLLLTLFVTVATWSALQRRIGAERR
jgi:holin-like protein